MDSASIIQARAYIIQDSYHWEDSERELLRSLIHVTRPGGKETTKRRTWSQIADGMNEKTRAFSMRNYTESNCRAQWARHIAPIFCLRDPFMFCAWHEGERELMREFIHVSRAGGKEPTVRRSWEQIAICMIKNAGGERAYHERSCRWQWQKFIKDRYAKSRNSNLSTTGQAYVDEEGDGEDDDLDAEWDFSE
jgi:hypothetical protein